MTSQMRVVEASGTGCGALLLPSPSRLAPAVSQGLNEDQTPHIRLRSPYGNLWRLVCVRRKRGGEGALCMISVLLLRGWELRSVVSLPKKKKRSHVTVKGNRPLFSAFIKGAGEMEQSTQVL